MNKISLKFDVKWEYTLGLENNKKIKTNNANTNGFSTKTYLEEATIFVEYFYQIFYSHITTLKNVIIDKVTQNIKENSKIHNTIKYKQQFISKIKTKNSWVWLNQWKNKEGNIDKEITNAIWRQCATTVLVQIRYSYWREIAV